MSDATKTKSISGWPLTSKTARDLMTPNLVSIEADATVAEVLAFLTDTGYGATVIDEAGRPIGVVSRTDVVVYERGLLGGGQEVHGYYHHANLAAPGTGTEPAPSGDVRAQDLMTPAVFSVHPDTPASDVVGQMVDLNVHRLFVLDRAGVLVGVISALDLLRHLRP